MPRTIGGDAHGQLSTAVARGHCMGTLTRLRGVRVMCGRTSHGSVGLNALGSLSTICRWTIDAWELSVSSFLHT